MTGAPNIQGQARAREGGASASEERRRGFGWRRLQVVAAGVAIGSFAVPMVIEGEVEGFLAAMAAPFVVGLVLVRFLPRVAAIFLGVVSAATLAFSAPFIAEALSHPESATDFVPLSWLTVSTVIAAVAAIPAYREVGRKDVTFETARGIAIAAGLVAVVASVFSLAAAARVDSVAAQPGDVVVETRNFAFAPDALTAQAGTISVHLANDDSTRHTFTIDGLTDLSVPPRSAQRITFEAAPGTYRFYCRPHVPDMDGVLVVQ